MASLSSEEIKELIGRRNRWTILSTYGPDGFPHSVPMGCFMNGDDFILGCKDRTQKVVNLERESRCSLLWENGRGEDSLIGILIRGHGRVVRGDEERLALKKEACRQRGESPPSEVGGEFVYIVVTPEKVTSWSRPSGRKSTAKTK